MSQPKDKLHFGLGEIAERHPLPWSHHVLMIKDANGQQVVHLGGLTDGSGKPHNPYLLAGLAALLVERANDTEKLFVAPAGFSQEHQLDVDFETARALHRVVRAMHDGECPKCHALFESLQMRGDRSSTFKGNNTSHPWTMNMTCPSCKFTISESDADAAIQAFAPIMEKCVQVFEDWRQKRS